MTERIAAELLAPVRRETGRDGDVALAGKDAFASLPVLGAVRQFIDNERRRTRRMILSLVTLFAVVLMVFVVAFIYVAGVQMNRVKTDLEKGQQEIAAAASQIVTLKKDITDEAQKLNKQFVDGEKQAAAALQAVQSLDASITGAVGELQLLKKNINGTDDFKRQSMKALADLEMRWSDLSSRFDALSQQNVFLRSKLAEKPVASSYVPVVATAARDEGIILDMAPSNAERRINWRLPMP